MVKIKNIENKNGIIKMKFYLDTKEDGFLAQEIFRSIINYSFSIESNFGFQENLEEILVFSYSCSSKKINTLSFSFINNLSEYKLIVK